jgi:protein ImuB
MAASEKPSTRSRDATPTPAAEAVREPARARPRAAQQSLDLAETPPIGPRLEPLVPLSHLWLCLYLPALPLEALVDGSVAAAVFEEQQGMRRVLLANPQATAAGIMPGQAVNAALALLPDLDLVERNPAREARVLAELAEWSERFTSFVSIEPPSLLLLEIAGSLTLFGGVRALRQRIVGGLDSQGFAASVAIAPTPLAATWFARAGQRVCVRNPQNLVGRLGSLPVTCLGWPQAVLSSLKGMGIATIGEALRLPRQGFARRFGAGRLLALDRALGRLPDPRVGYRSPEQFITDFDLNEEQDDAALILTACRELLLRLERFLRSRQIAVQHIEFDFFHLRQPATRLSLGCVQPDRAAGHWLDLLGIRFERLELPEPVIAIRLSAGQGQSFAADTGLLSFDTRAGQRREQRIAHLAERLSARIGDDSVHGVTAVAEHRPQYAWQPRTSYEPVPACAKTPAFAGGPQAPELLAEFRRTERLVLRRPLWVLPEPEPLDTEAGEPRYQGPLRIVSGPERIETGWWDDHGIARDYYVAKNPRGMHLWIYQDRGHRKGAWFLHGKFG